MAAGFGSSSSATTLSKRVRFLLALWIATTNVAGFLTKRTNNAFGISPVDNFRVLESVSRDDPDRISIGCNATTTTTTTTTTTLPRREFLTSTSATAIAAAIGYPFSSDAIETVDSTPRPTIEASDSSSMASDSTIPFSSSRQLKALTLANGIQVLLVSDKRAQLANAALTIEGAGQFSDPYVNGTIPLSGLAHLMEHMVLSANNRGRVPTIRNNLKTQEFEEWLADREGASNGFTAYEKVCFHFSCPYDSFPEALERFAGLFYQEVVDRTCRKKETIAREVRRVNSELNFTNTFTRELYLTKSLMNPDHPYARFSAGNLETLDTIPATYGIDMTEQLQDFFAERYLPKNAILVAVSPSSLDAMELWVAPFATALSKRKSPQQATTIKPRTFPEPFPKQTRVSPICIFRPKGSSTPLDENYEKLTFQWALDLDYSELKTDKSRNCITSTQIGFILSQVLARRGPGSLYTLLRRRGWVPDSTKGLPSISFPVDVSGFQIMKLELTLTLEGFASRSAVIAAVYDGINSLQSTSPKPFLLSRELIAQYCTIAKLYGSILAPRPPDAVELAFDGQFFGVTGPLGIGTPGWNRFPTAQDTAAIKNLQKEISQILRVMSDPANAIIIVTASKNAIKRAQDNVFDNSLPPLSPASWNIAPITGARYYYDNMFRLSGKVNEWLVARLLEDELSPPVLNPLVPPTLRPARLLANDDVDSNKQSISPEDGSTISTRKVFFVNKFLRGSTQSPFDEYAEVTYSDPTRTSIVRDYWAVLRVLSHDNTWPALQLPRVPPEPSSRSAFVLQLLSSRPARADTNMAAHAELWKVSFEYAAADLGELGLPAGCAYDISFNKFGMRVCFLGLSQNIASYARRLSRRIVDHQNKLLDQQGGFPQIVVDTALRNGQRARNMSPLRKRQVVTALRQCTTTEAAVEGISFFKSCSGGVCYSQGDLLPSETAALLGDLKGIFRRVTGSNIRPAPAIPELEEIVYRPNWIPRAASVCSIPGSNLVSDPCGRVRR